MKILHVNAGLEKGGGLFHIINLLSEAKNNQQDWELLTLAEGPVAQAARANGIPVHVLGKQNRYNLTVLSSLASFINQGGYEVVHTHGARANLFVSLIRRKIKAKWVVTVHSDPSKDFAGRGLLGQVFTKLNKRALRKADLVLTVTKRFRQLVSDYVNPKNIKVIYNGIKFHPDDEIAPKISHDSTFDIINVARAEKIKGQDLLLKAIKQIDDPHLRLHIVGDGTELSALKQLAAQLKIDRQVQFHGFLRQDQIAELYRSMDLAILTSYSESFPLVLLEASDNLVPICSTDVGDMHVLIPGPNHGFIADVGNVDMIASQIESAADMRPTDLMTMARIEKNYLVNNFSVKKQFETILDDYKEVLSFAKD